MNILEALLHAVKFISRILVHLVISSPANTKRVSFNELTSKDKIDFVPCHFDRQKIGICHCFNLYFVYLLIYKKSSYVKFRFLYIANIPDFDITISNF